MKYHMFKYTCGQCGSIYKAPEVRADSYGEFLMRSRSGETVHLHAISDKTYDEVDLILKKIPELNGASATQLAKIQRRVFGVACDTDRQGNRYSIETKPLCPTCGHQSPSYWEATDPPELVDIEIPQVTHDHWEKLSRVEKIKMLERSF